MKTMAEKLINIPNDDTQHYTLCRLQLLVETIGHPYQLTNQSRPPKLLCQRIRKLYLKLCGLE